MSRPDPQPSQPPRTLPEARTDDLSHRRGLHAVLSVIGHNVGDFHAALGTYLVLGLVGIFAASGAFAFIADEMVEGGTQRFDDAVLLWMNAHASRTLTGLALEVTSLGSGSVVIMTLLVSSAFLWVSRHRYSVLLLWVAVIGEEMLNLALKSRFDRPRPRLFPWRTPMTSGQSFPSGHAMTSMVVYLTLAYLIARLEPGVGLRRATFAVAGLLIVLIGLSRMYLGVHYPSDVVAGYAAGFAWATFCALGIEAIQHFRAKKPEVEQHEKDLRSAPPPVSDGA